MRLPYSIAITIGFITCLSSFMLGLGQNDFLLPLLMFVAAAVSLYVTDFRRWIRLGDWTVNVLVLLIVFMTIGDIVRNQGEDLAFSIARTLVFVEMVLLFREKDPRFCWQILLISLLQVVVATVLQQSLLFGFLLLVYVFSGLCVFVQVFLLRENMYFRRHSFVGTFFDSIKAEIAARQDHGKLVRIALITLITGPLSLVFSFTPTKNGQNNGSKLLGDRKMTPQQLLRTFFAVFPSDQGPVKGQKWEMIGETPSVASMDSVSTDGVPMKTISSASSVAETESKTWYDSIWVEPEHESIYFQDDNRADGKAPKKKLVPVPEARRSLRRKKHSSDLSASRFPLLSERPGFSAGTTLPDGMQGGGKELFFHLVRGTLFALIFAILLFCFIPRIGKIEFWTYPIKFGQDNWSKNFVKPVGTVGFSEEVRLGSLGSVLPYHREVMTIRFSRIPENILPSSFDELVHVETPYDEIRGATLYFHGVALDRYRAGSWTQSKQQENPFGNPTSNPLRRPPPQKTSDFPKPPQPRIAPQPDFLPLRPGQFIKPSENERLFYEDGLDLVCLHMNIQPLDSTVFFAPWPFFSPTTEGPPIIQSQIRGRVNEIRKRNEPLSTIIYSTAFKHGGQILLVPCQEEVEMDELLQIPEDGLDTLKEMARKWDEQSGLPKDDLIGRASYMERKFLMSERFSYKLGKTARDLSLDPLEDFVLRNPTGHCEYFAGALALMLRSVGIGSRVVVGFKTYAQSGGQACVVRQSDAHAWVNVYIPPNRLGERAYGPFGGWWKQGGWYRLDPTPASDEPQLMKKVTFSLTDLNNEIQKLWGDFVLNMNATKQTEWIYDPIRNGVQYLGERVFNVRFWIRAFPLIIDYYKQLIFKSNGAVWQARDWGLLAIPIVIFLAILALSVYLLYRLWPLLRRNSAEARRRRATVDFYVRMERLLSSRGHERNATETPLEYVRKFEFVALTVPVVDLFYRVRFGDAVLSDEEIRSVRHALDQLEESLMIR